jgi:outer membrane biogenesis lipoprotein LolB
MTRLAVLVACSAALLVVGCGGTTPPPAATSSPSTGAKRATLPELTQIGQLQAAFAAHPGVPRLVILLSPT